MTAGARPARTWFITGGSPGGFGMAFAEAAVEVGDRVVLTARPIEPLREWAHAQGDRVLVLQLDVTEPGQVREAVSAGETQFGGIDVLVNNAGRGWYGSVEGMDDSSVRELFELNFFAVLSVTRAVLPGMRARGSGWIVNMSSAAGLRGVIGFGYYSAAKHAIEGLTDVLRDEVAGLGIRVLAVEPGAFRTQAYAGFAGEPIRETIPDYHPMLEQVRTAIVDQHGKQPGDPRRGARAVIEAMNQDPPPLRLILGSTAFDAVTATLEHTLADIRTGETLSRGADFPTGPQPAASASATEECGGATDTRHCPAPPPQIYFRHVTLPSLRRISMAGQLVSRGGRVCVLGSVDPATLVSGRGRNRRAPRSSFDVHMDPVRPPLPADLHGQAPPDQGT